MFYCLTLCLLTIRWIHLKYLLLGKVKCSITYLHGYVEKILCPVNNPLSPLRNIDKSNTSSVSDDSSTEGSPARPVTFVYKSRARADCIYTIVSILLHINLEYMIFRPIMCIGYASTTSYLRSCCMSVESHFLFNLCAVVIFCSLYFNWQRLCRVAGI